MAHIVGSNSVCRLQVVDFEEVAVELVWRAGFGLLILYPVVGIVSNLGLDYKYPDVLGLKKGIHMTDAQYIKML